jgi:hypothetical protein
LHTKYEAKAAENTKLQQSLKEHRNMCLSWSQPEKFTPSAENISSTFGHIEGDVEALDEVIAGHGTSVPC